MEKGLNKILKRKRTISKERANKCPKYDTESSSIEMLNDDCLEQIFQFLPIRDTVRVKEVCKRWKNAPQNLSWNMKTLDLSSRTWGVTELIICSATFHKILKNCGRFLTRINLSKNQDNSLNASRNTMSTIIKFCPNLEQIDLSGIRVHKANIRDMVQKFRNIIKLNLGPINGEYDEELQALFRANSSLEYLKFNDKCSLRKCLLDLPAQSMHTIKFWRCNFQDNLNNYLPMALEKLKNLTYFQIHRCTNVSTHILETVSIHCRNITKLELNIDCSLSTMVSLFQLSNLQSLIVPRNVNISDEFLTNLARHCPQLTCINISYCQTVTDTGLMALATLKLKKLYIHGLRRITGESLQNMCCLEELRCEGCLSITDQNMSMFIKSAPLLKLLHIKRCKNITKVTLQAAIDACESRTNDVMLEIFAGGTQITDNLKSGKLSIMV